MKPLLKLRQHGSSFKYYQTEEGKHIYYHTDGPGKRRFVAVEDQKCYPRRYTYQNV